MSTTALVGGHVITMDPTRPTAELVVIQDGRLAAVGAAGDLARFPGADVIDVTGRTLVPGFIDAHLHLCIAALHPRWADLSGVSDIAQLHAALLAQARAEPDTEWVRGVGWTDLGTGLRPTRHDLDALGLDRPVIVVHFSYHECVVSSAGLDRLGIGRTTPDPPGGEIARAPDGAPTGLLIERAFSAAHAASIAPYLDPDRWDEYVVAEATRLLADGITCVHDAACPPPAEAMYERLARSNRLPVSILAMPHPEALLAPLDDSRLDGAPTGEGDETLRIGPVKLFADGGALPGFAGTVHGQPFRVGFVFDDLAAEATRVVDHGFGVAMHAIGNAGLDAALDAFEAAEKGRPADDHRFRIEHASVASPAQIRRMAAAGVIGVVQPGFLHHMGGAVEGFDIDGTTWMPFGDFARAGVVLAASSDGPCAFQEPLLTSARGVTRVTSTGSVLAPDQSLPYVDWLHAYTAGAAYAGGQEHERGRLAPGLRADIVVIDGDLDPERPPRVAETWVSGARVYTEG
jgi:predicted amidohydrolase YtcJ